MLSREDWDKLSPEEQYRYAYWLTWADDQYQGLLDLIPECPVHGHQCIPHASEWVIRQREEEQKRSEELKRLFAPAFKQTDLFYRKEAGPTDEGIHDADQFTTG